MKTLLPCAVVLGSLVAADAARALTPAELAARLARNEPPFLIDVRPATAYQEGHIPGAMNIPLSLLPLKQLPTSQPVVVYGDGLGLIDDAQALTAVRAKQGLRAEALEGGYAAWLAQTRLTTARPGVSQERLPGITYGQLVAATKGDMVLLDLRSSATPATAAGAPRMERQVAAAPAPDILAGFAAKIGVPVISAGTPAVAAPALAGTAAAAGTPARAAAPALDGAKSGKLLVLVADNEAAATEVARQLRASGNYRFTILIGGTESIRNEGRIGTGRMDGNAAPVYSR